MHPARWHKTNTSTGKNIFAAVRSGDLPAVKAFLEQGADLFARNEYGFTALPCAAMGCNTTDEQTAVAIIELLLKAGSPVEAAGRQAGQHCIWPQSFHRQLPP
jgi:ankyrin repeat protein